MARDDSDEKIVIIMRNGSGDELDRAIAENDADVKRKLLKMIEESELAVGDTFSIEME